MKSLSGLTITRRGKIVAWSLLFSAAFTLGISTGGWSYYDHSNVQQAQYIEEDSALWDCRTMGNHICG